MNPLDATAFLRKPCDLVDDARVTELGGQVPGEADVDSDLAKNLTGPTCTWNAGHGYFDVAIHTPHSEFASKGLQGIAGIYGGKEAGLVHELQPTEIAGHPGYPGAFAWRGNEKEQGECPLYVGIRDDMTFVAGVVNDDNPSVACEEAMKLAASVLDTLKKGA